MRILPGDNCEIGDLMQELLDVELLMMYELDGSKYGAVRDFTKYQRPRKPSIK